MDGQQFDTLTRAFAAGASRRKVLRGLATGALGLAGLGAARHGAEAAPQTCVTCTCGVGRPCNPRSTTCAVLRQFPAGTTCEQACAAQNQHFCGGAQQFHCPHGCPA
jgi:hypothetical protein